MNGGIAIAPATGAQLPEILAIYNEVIRNTTAVYSDTEVTLEDREKWFDAKGAQGFPVLVATDSSGVVRLRDVRRVSPVARAIGTASSTACTCGRIAGAAA